MYFFKCTVPCIPQIRWFHWKRYLRNSALKQSLMIVIAIMKKRRRSFFAVRVTICLNMVMRSNISKRRCFMQCFICLLYQIIFHSWSNAWDQCSVERNWGSVAVERSSRLRSGAYVCGFKNKEVIHGTSESCYTEWEWMRSRQTIHSLVK